MDPLSIAILGGTALLSFFGKKKEAKAQRDAEQQAAAYNEQVAWQNAQQQRQQTDEEVRRYDIDRRKREGQIRASFGASGAAFGGTALDVLGESAAMAEQDIQTIRQGGSMKERLFESEARFEQMRFDNAQKKYRTSTLSAFLGTGFNTYSEFRRAK